MISTNVFFSPIFYLLFFWDSQPMIYSYRSLEILLQIPKALLLFSVMSFSLFSPPVFLISVDGFIPHLSLKPQTWESY